MNPHWLVIALGVLSGIFWLTAVLSIDEFFVKGTHRPQIHHWYFGMVAILLPWWQAWIVGLALCLDDTVQHVGQETDLSFETPAHRFYDWVYRHLPKAIQHILDKV